MAYLTDENLSQDVGVVIGFTERTGGNSVGPYASMNLGDRVGDDQEAMYLNRRAVFNMMGLEGYLSEFINPLQVHGDEVFLVREKGQDLTPALDGADAVCVLCTGVPVLLCFADCTPVIAVAPTGQFAVIHAGWRGALAGIVGKACRLLAEESASDPAELNLYIGPHIGACCYETSPAILKDFREKYGPACDSGDNRLSLSAAVIADAKAAGLVEERICDSDICTMCNEDRFFSYRASGGTCGRHGAIACAL